MTSKMELTAQTSTKKYETTDYRRRLDRSPSNDFNRLHKGERILICRLRTALEEAKERTVKLREENEVKDDMICQERKQREIVEERLQKFLVDVYNNPKINSELRERLPKARNYDPLHLESVESHHTDVRENFDSSDVDYSCEKAAENSTDPLVQAHVMNGVVESEYSPATFGLNSASQAALNNETPIQAHIALPNQHSNQVMNRESHPQIYSDASLYTFFPHLTTSTSSIGTGLSSSYLDLPPAGAAKDKHIPVYKEDDTLLTTGLMETIPLNDGPELEKDGAKQRENIQKMNSSFLQQVPMSTVRNHYSQPYQPPSDNVSHITRLLAEISTLKKENQELKADLDEKKHDLEILKDELQHVKEDGDKDDSVAALIEMVHSAGKTREKALAQMVSSAQQDRDIVLGELDRMRLKASEKSMHAMNASNNDSSDLEETEENYAASGCVSVETEPEDLRETPSIDTEPSLEELKKLISRQRETMQEDMKEVLQERDHALLKAAKLEKKLCALEITEFSSDTIESLMAKLRITETERDIAIGKLRKLSENFGEIKLLNNLRQALVSDSSQLKLKQTEKNKQVDSDKWELGKNNNMTASLNKQIEENNKLEKKIVLLEYKNKDQTQQIEKLQALIKRQRQKLDALCAGPLLIEG